jgi:chemotaxis protein CheZ
MDAAGAISALVAGTPKADKINEHITQIYNACTFQDVSSQRITKVMKTIRAIEEKVSQLADALQGSAGALTAVKPAAAASGEPDLLSGPQLPDSMPSQDDIDKMFSKP